MMESMMTGDVDFEAGAPIQAAQLVALNTRLRWACHAIRMVALAWVVWDLGVLSWTWGDRATSLEQMARLYNLDPAKVTDAGYGSAFALALIAWLTTAIVVVYIWRLVRVYLDGQVFTVEAAARLRAVAVAGLASTAAGIALSPIAAALISAELLSEIPLYYWLRPEHLLYILICGFILALSIIFKTAAEIAGEHAQFV
jgi:hypothetical protein